MKVKAILAKLIPLIILAVLFSFNEALPRDFKYRVRIYQIDGEPFIIDGFYHGDGRNQYEYYRAKWGGSWVDISFKNIKSIKFLSPGQREPEGFYKVEILFIDGKKNTFEIKPFGMMHGKSDFGHWEMSHTKAVRIEFNPSTTPVSQISTQSKEFDQILFKNGDIFTGRIKTEAFKLRASYATLNFTRSEIDFIEFEGGGNNIDTMILKSGDKLSGVIEAPIITISIKSDKEVNLDKEKIKKISFSNM